MTETPNTDAVTLVRMRNDFYRDNYRRVIGALLLAVLVIFGLGATFAYVIMNPPAPRYIAVNAEGRIIPLKPLSEPNMSPSALLQWANTAAIAAYTYSYVNYRSELQTASEFFTPDGWQSFLDALKSSGNLNAVIQEKLIVSAVATEAPFILQEGLLNGVYSWKIQFGMLISYQSASKVAQQQVTVTMLIQRVSPLSSARGIGIAQFLVGSG
ncbi:MAG: type IVB secretion system apparatus protein IcmL/DotI [Gammaproteobacteria bacterium]